MNQSEDHKLFYYVGDNAEQSFLPMIHAHINLYTYKTQQLSPENIQSFLHHETFGGLNADEKIGIQLAHFCDFIAPEAVKMNSIDTVVKNEQGKICGYNIASIAFLNTIQRSLSSLNGKQILIIGNNERTYIAHKILADAGANAMINFADDINFKEYSDAEILICTGSLKTTQEQFFHPEKFPNLRLVVETDCNSIRSTLIQQANKFGIPSISGLQLLLEKARLTAELFSNTSVKISEIEKIWDMIKRDTMNCVLIGMPGSGKTTVGKIVAQLLQRPVIDLDEWITEQSGMTPAEIFATFGEAKFRELERNAATILGEKRGFVLLTGGGTVLNPENMFHLASNGRIYFIKRPIELLACGNDRPLSSNRMAVKKLAEERLPLYNATCDISVDNTEGKPESAAEKIVTDWNNF